MIDSTAPPWWLLVVSLPTQSATARMRIWRALKAKGCAALRDGAYLLPERAGHEALLQDLAEQCQREGGSAWLLAVQMRSDDATPAWRALFDRSPDYAKLRSTWKLTKRALAAKPMPELLRLQRRLQREFEGLRSIDFFPTEASLEAEAAWVDLGQRFARLLAPDEPQSTDSGIARLDIADYQGRLWATRRRLWVDRVASAWLIRRFIDRSARFHWLAEPADCPQEALGFDFDGAHFSHVGDRVSFQTLLASFDLEQDAALLRLGALVHQLDIGGEPVAEASGFEAVMSGARLRLGDDDDTLLDEIGRLLDSLYAHFGQQATQAALANPQSV